MIAIGCDHAAVKLKNTIKEHLIAHGMEVEDFGCFSDASVDYPDYALKVAEAVAEQKCDKGILICGTGIGMSMAANKVKGVRCAHCSDTFSAKATRQHNDANVLALGERVVGVGLALEIVDCFVNTPFSNDERHIRRINKINDIESKYFK
ncbi:MAG: ribose 5-phosphate isomerase B [Clostridia bacterium]|nr:ribose 5-phosphate isomerase B [Clostridiales bacterium]MBR2970640.1 ribose 5-phosphate isomerase B [Clostridia bacterium]